MKKRFQLWYVEVYVSAAAIKHKSASWIISTWSEIQEYPELGINGFRKAGVLDTISSVSDVK